MKNINVPLTDEEYLRLIETKGDKTWHDYLMILPTLEEVKIHAINFPKPGENEVSPSYAEELDRWFARQKELLGA